MKKKNRLISLVLVMLLLFGMTPSTVLAAGQTENQTEQEKEIQAVYEALRDAISAEDGINATLKLNDDNELDIKGTQIAELSVAPDDSTRVYCDFLKPEFEAINLLDIPFLAKLFDYEKISSMSLTDINWDTNYLSAYLNDAQNEAGVVYRVYNEGMLTEGEPVLTWLKDKDYRIPTRDTKVVESEIQRNLMLGILTSVMARYEGKIKKFDQTFANNGTGIPLSFLDQTQVPITLNGETESGEDFQAPLTLYFFNHDAEHKVTFKNGDIEIEPSTKKKYGEQITVPSGVKGEEGKTLIGWDRSYVDFDNKTIKGGTALADLNNETMGPFDVVYTAVWAKNAVDVTFHYEDDSTDDKKISQATGQKWQLPTEPVREGYVFEGWFTKKEEGGKKIGEIYNDNNITEVWAHWKKNPVVTFNDNNGSRTEVATDENGKLPDVSDPEKTGYRFDYWCEGSEDGSRIDLQNETFYEDTIVYAHWTANTYTVKFESGGGTGGMDEQHFTYDQEQELSANQFTRKGYTFDGWKGSDGKTYTDKQKVQNLTSDPEGKVTLEAQWKANEYQVTLNLNGGILNGKEEDIKITVTYGDLYGNKLPLPTRTGYNFAGWHTNDGKQVTNETKVGEILDVTETNPTLTARWNAKGNTNYRVEYYQQNLNDDQYTQVTRDSYEGTGATDTEITPVQKEYPGFHLNVNKSDESGTIGGDGTTVFRLYYDRNVYTVTWHIGDQVETEKYRYGATPSHDGKRKDTDFASYTFEGWKPELKTVTRNITYTAQYTEHHGAKIGTAFYRNVNTALKYAESGDTVVLTDDCTLEQDTVVPSGVMLLLPVSGTDAGYSSVTGFNPDGTNSAKGQFGKSDDANVLYTLNVPKGVTMTINGTVLVNAVTGRPHAGYYDMDVTGAYGQIDLDGNIVVDSGGILDVCGYVTGSGTVTAKPDGEVRDLYLVRHWRGGSQAYDIFPDVYPMNEVDMHNIEVKTVIEAGASLVGTVKMFASDEYHYTRFPQIDRENGLIRQTSGSITKTYDRETNREKWQLAGTGSIGSSLLEIVGVELTTASFLYPIDGDLDFELSGKWDVTEKLKFMPGATIRLKDDATLTATKKTARYSEDNQFVLYDSFQPEDAFQDVTGYPKDREPAVLTLEGGTTTKLQCANGARIEVDTSATEQNPAKISIARGVSTTVDTLEAGGTEQLFRTLTFRTTIGGESVEAGWDYLCWREGSETKVVKTEPMLELTIDYPSEKLEGFWDDRSYTINGETVVVDHGTTDIQPEWMGTEVEITSLSNEEDSRRNVVQTLAIPARPAAPTGLMAETTSEDGASDGSIRGLDPANRYEYRMKITEAAGSSSTSTSTNWISAEEGASAIENLTAATYEVRVQASGNAFASESASVTVTTRVSSSSGSSGSSGSSSFGSSGSGSSTSGSSTQQPDSVIDEEPVPENSGVSVEVLPEVSVENGASSSRIEGASLADALNQAKGTGAETLVVQSTVDESVTSATVTITQDASQMVVDAGLDLKIQTNNGTLDLPNEAVQMLHDSLTVTFGNNEDGSTTVSVLEGQKSATLAASAKVLLPVAADATGSAEEGNVLCNVQKDGKEEVIPYSFVRDRQAVTYLDSSMTLKLEDRSKTFGDVSGASWYSSAVTFVSAHEMFHGTDSGQFCPQDTMTRGMIVQVLKNIEKGESFDSNGFSDVTDDAWYAEAASWASNLGIVRGYGDGTFGAGDSVTREQMAVILYNYVKKLNYGVEGSGNLSKFQDASGISSWAGDAMSWAVGAGIFNGSTDGTLNPQGCATRAEMAQIMENFTRALLNV